MKLIHFRVSSDKGKAVRTFCDELAKRTATKRFTRILADLRAVSPITCSGCRKIGWDYTLKIAKAPTLKRVRAFCDATYGNTWPKHQRSAAEQALADLEQAQQAGAAMGNAINAKYKATERAVARASAAILSQRRKLKIAATFLKKAEQRHARLVKKLAKTPQYTPQKEGTTDENETNTEASVGHEEGTHA